MNTVKKSLRNNSAANILNSTGREIMETNEKLNNNQENKAQSPPVNLDFLHENKGINKKNYRKNQRVACIYVF